MMLYKKVVFTFPELNKVKGIFLFKVINYMIKALRQISTVI